MEGQELIGQVKSLAERIGVKTVYGEPLVAGETTVVPVASVAFGFGGGGKARDGEGGGGGAGFRGWPAGYIEITPAGTRFVPARENRKIAMALLAGIAIGYLAGKLGKSKKA